MENQSTTSMANEPSRRYILSTDAELHLTKLIILTENNVIRSKIMGGEWGIRIFKNIIKSKHVLVERSNV